MSDISQGQDKSRLAREDPKPINLWSLILGATLAVVFSAGVGYLVFLFVLESYKIVPAEAARTAVTLVGVPTAAGAVFVALRSLRLKEKQLHTDQLRLADAALTYDLAFDSEHNRRQSDQERELRSRYVSAAEQMGSESAAVRLAGVNAMAQLADDWHEQRQSCVDVLCAYLRLPQLKDSTGDRDAADGEVRRTVQGLIAKGFRMCGSDGHPKWTNVDLDLRGAVLRDFQMSKAATGKASFVDAEFLGFTSFLRTDFGEANFRNARFSHTVNFADCKFGKATFYLAKFMGGARFRRATFIGAVNFAKAVFASRPSLEGVISERRIQFLHTTFGTHPDYRGEGYEVVLRGCNINGDPIPDVNVRTTFVSFDEDNDDLV